jgi:hypothetical protein
VKLHFSTGLSMLLTPTLPFPSPGPSPSIVMRFMIPTGGSSRGATGEEEGGKDGAHTASVVTCRRAKG